MKGKRSRKKEQEEGGRKGSKVYMDNKSPEDEGHEGRIWEMEEMDNQDCIMHE